MNESDNRGQNRTQQNEENPTARVRNLKAKNSFAETHLQIGVRGRNRVRRIARANATRGIAREMRATAPEIRIYL